MNVPVFKQYFPSFDDMDQSQKKFYNELERKLSKGFYVDIEGNVSYVFVYIYKLLSKWNTNGFEKLSDYLLHLSEIYRSEKILSDYCKNWAYDCLLGLSKYEEYLDKTEPKEVFGNATYKSNLRLNIQYHQKLEANPIDLLLMAGGRRSKFICSNETLYKDKIREVFVKYENENGNWFSLFEKWINQDKRYSHSLFQGAPIMFSPKLNFGLFCFYTSKEYLELSKALSREAENLARLEIGVPLIGEGWISETELFRKLEARFQQTIVIQHGQPYWLGKQHFDIWFPNWKIAVEYHGKQHFEPVDFFGGIEAFIKTQERDKRKLNLSKRHGVKLFIVRENDDTSDVISEIEKIRSEYKIEIPIL